MFEICLKTKNLHPKFIFYMGILFSGHGVARGPVAALGAELSDSPSFELCTGVVVQADPGVVYLMRAQGGIEAVEFRTGRTLWNTTEFAKPLMAFRGRLLVQKEAGGRPGVLPIRALDTRKGSQTSLKLDIPLSPKVRAMIDQSLGVSFSARAWEEGGSLLVAWDYLDYGVTGVSPPPGAAPFRLREEAMVRVDLDSGRIERLSERAHTHPLPASVQQLVDSGELLQPPRRIGPILAATVDQAAPGGPRVILRRWDAQTGAPLPEVTLFAGRPVARLPSADQRHLLISSLLEANRDAWDRYLWSVYSLASGELVGRIRYHRSANRFAVLGTQLLHLSQPFGRRAGDGWVEEPLKLRAVDLDGAELWNRLLHDTSYRGARPPGQ